MRRIEWDWDGLPGLRHYYEWRDSDSEIYGLWPYTGTVDFPVCLLRQVYADKYIQ